MLVPKFTDEQLDEQLEDPTDPDPADAAPGRARPSASAPGVSGKAQRPKKRRQAQARPSSTQAAFEALEGAKTAASEISGAALVDMAVVQQHFYQTGQLIGSEAIRCLHLGVNSIFQSYQGGGGIEFFLTQVGSNPPAASAASLPSKAAATATLTLPEGQENGLISSADLITCVDELFGFGTFSTDAASAEEMGVDQQNG